MKSKTQEMIYIFSPSEGTIYSRKNGTDLDLLISRLNNHNYEYHFVDKTEYDYNEVFDLD